MFFEIGSSEIVFMVYTMLRSKKLVHNGEVHYTLILCWLHFICGNFRAEHDMEWRRVLPLNPSFGQKLCAMPQLSNGNHEAQSIQYCRGWVKIRVNWRPAQMLLVSNIAVGRLTLESIENPVHHYTNTKGCPSDSVFSKCEFLFVSLTTPCHCCQRDGRNGLDNLWETVPLT